MSEDATLDDFVDAENTEETETAIESDEDTGTHPRFGSLPSDWNIKEVAEIADVIGGSTPSTDNDDYWDGEIWWATPTDITGLSGNTIEETADTLTKEGLESASTHLLPPRSVLMTSRATIGACAVNTVEMATNQGFKSLVPKDGIETWYLHYRLLETAAFLESLGSGSTFDEVSKTVVETVDIPVPPVSEQRKIATVLHTVDQAIQKTEEIIEQVERLKKGVGQDLIHTGIEYPQTKSAWMGEIPSHWDVREFSELVDLSQNGIYKENDDYDGPYPIIKMGDIFGGVTLDTPIAERVHLEDDEVEKYATEEGDLVFARHAQAGWGAGDCTYVPDLDEPAVVESNMVHVRLTNDVDPLFYAQYFNHEIGVKSIKRITTTGNIKSISQGDLMSLKVPVPPKEEQEEISNMLSVFDKQTENSKSEVERLRRLKQALMQDLLSGTVQTTDTNIEVPDEIAQHG